MVEFRTLVSLMEDVLEWKKEMAPTTNNEVHASLVDLGKNLGEEETATFLE